MCLNDERLDAIQLFASVLCVARLIRLPTILRILRFELGLSRKILEQGGGEGVREALPREVDAFMGKLRVWYRYPEQMVFVNETSKNGLDSMRRYAWSTRDARAVVRVPFSRGKCVSILAACDVSGFIGWLTTRGTFTHLKFHRAFMCSVVTFLNPWPMPRSTVVLDNARIHIYKELEDAAHACGAVIIFLPPYCPQCNPIEITFGQLKRWLIRHTNVVFPLYPELVLRVAMCACIESSAVGVNLFRYCGYCETSVNDSVFRVDIDFLVDPWGGR